MDKGTIVRIKPNVFYRGFNLSGRIGVVVSSDSYILVEFSEIDEPVKILQYEIEATDVEIFDFIEYSDFDNN